MLRILPTAAALAVLVTPLEAQVGLSSATRTVVLTATKHGSLGVALLGGGAATLPGGPGLRANDVGRVPVETRWDLDPSQTPTATLVAYVRPPEAGTPGGTVELLSQPVTDGAAVRIGVTGRPGTLNLLVTTQ